MREKTAGKIFLVLFYAMIYSSGDAGAGTGAAAMLTLPLGVRASGMGEAYTSVGDDVSSIYYNPAGLARVRQKEASFLYQSGFINDTFGALNLGLPLESGAAAVSYFYYTTGKLDLLDSNGDALSINAEEDYALTLSVSRRLSSIADIGFNLKLLNSTIAEEFTATALAFDIGGLYQVIGDELFLGLSVQNIGAKLTYDTETEALPTVIRSGISYNFVSSIVSFDVVSPGAGNTEKCIGFEYYVQDMTALRCGYRNMGDSDEISIGFGVELSNMKVDYAWSPDAELGDCHRISLNMKWKAKTVVKKKEKLSLPGAWKFFMEARNLLQRENYKSAQKKFKKVLKLAPNHEETKRCIFLCQRKIYENLSPDGQRRYIDKCFMKGIDLLERKEYHKAVDYFEEVYNLNRGYPQVKDYLRLIKNKLKT